MGISFFNRSKFLEFNTVTPEDYDILVSDFIDGLKKLTPVGAIKVSAENAGHAEYISWDLWDDVSMWWILCEYNDLIDPFNDFTVGTLIQYPSVSALEILALEVFQNARNR